jgi:hypothetical protein
MMETHYNNPAQDTEVSDSSGIRVYYTASLRRHDAGVLSVGLDPNWRHIIPPGQPEVLSEGHCISACTQNTVPPQGINVFGAALHTHLIGRLKYDVTVVGPGRARVYSDSHTHTHTHTHTHIYIYIYIYKTN